MSLYRDCLLAVSLEMKSLFLFWSSHGYVCMVSSLYLPSLKFVLCISLHGEESILAMSVVLVCLAVS